MEEELQRLPPLPHSCSQTVFAVPEKPPNTRHGIFQQGFTQILITRFRVATPKAETDLLRQLQLGAVGSLLGLQPHQVGNRSVQKMQERGRKDGDIHVLPLKREQQRCDPLCHCHQTLVI